MRVLILTEHFFPDTGAIDQINLALAQELVRRGHDVAVIRSIPEASCGEDEHEGIRIYTRPRKVVRQWTNKSGRFRRRAADIRRRLARKSPKLSLEFIGNLTSLVRVVRREKPQVILAVSHPFEILQLGSVLARVSQTPWIMYSMDPYFNNPLFPKEQLEERLAQERKLIAAAQSVIVPAANYSAYCNYFPQFLNKTSVLGFPRIAQLNRSASETTLEKREGRINCVFVGWMYPKLRNPSYVFDLFTRLPADRFHLSVIGGVLGEFPSNFMEYWKYRLGDQLKLVGQVPMEQAADAILDADILINIGNLSNNQLPSKILEYLSSGKPIVNFVKVPDCPTLRYTQDFPAAINIPEYEPLTDAVVLRFVEFCESTLGCEVDFAEVQDLYPEDTLPVVVNRLEEILEQALQ